MSYDSARSLGLDSDCEMCDFSAQQNNRPRSGRHGTDTATARPKRETDGGKDVVTTVSHRRLVHVATLVQVG